MDIWHFFMGVGGSLLGWLGNHLMGERVWGKIRDVAKEIAKDPTATNDPKEAITQALIKSQLERIAKEAAKVESAFYVNGTNPNVKAIPDSGQNDK